VKSCQFLGHAQQYILNLCFCFLCCISLLKLFYQISTGHKGPTMRSLVQS
jgi:hypothetical protein